MKVVEREIERVYQAQLSPVSIESLINSLRSCLDINIIPTVQSPGLLAHQFCPVSAGPGKPPHHGRMLFFNERKINFVNWEDIFVFNLLRLEADWIFLVFKK